MARQAHHHFIPSSYLKGFTKEGKDTSKFWGVPKNNDRPFITNPKDACSKRDYYSIQHEDPLVVEKWYANKVEPDINIALNHISKTKTLPGSNDMQYLLLLAATLYLRTPSRRASFEAPMKRTKEIVDNISTNIKITNADDFNYTKADVIRTELNLINTVIECLNNKYYRLYVSKDSKYDFITSDNPFILSHYNGGNNFRYGLNTPNVEIRIPLNRKTVLIGRNEKMKEGVFEADNQMIGLTNTKLILKTDRFFFSSKQEIALVDENISVYEHSIV